MSSSRRSPGARPASPARAPQIAALRAGRARARINVVIPGLGHAQQRPPPHRRDDSESPTYKKPLPILPRNTPPLHKTLCKMLCRERERQRHRRQRGREGETGRQRQTGREGERVWGRAGHRSCRVTGVTDSDVASVAPSVDYIPPFKFVTCLVRGHPRAGRRRSPGSYGPRPGARDEELWTGSDDRLRRPGPPSY